MTFEDFLRPFLEVVPSSYTFTLNEVVTVILLSFILSLIIGKTYSFTHHGVSYSQSYVQNLVILCVVVSCIMLIVGSNIARAFTLLGALSIVRFRNAIKDTHDVGFIFFTMAVGMACGTRFYSMAVLMTGLICLIQIAITGFQFGKRNDQQCLLRIVWPSHFERANKLDPLLKKAFKEYSLVQTASVSSDLYELSYIVSLKKKADENKIIQDIQSLSANQPVSFVYGDRNIEF